MKRHPPLDVSATDWRLIQSILHEHVPNCAVWAFGSRATGNAKKYSDLDLAIIGKQPIGLYQSAQLTEAFAESDLPYKVDVVDWATTSEAFRRIIEQNKVVIQQGTDM